ncbi:MAG: hypothetical protein HQM09_10055 [Candidatus Riflebacteria bacterium]|nr:hypothetical protein [Candidatus Riflebacteria bacterium]
MNSINSRRHAMMLSVCLVIGLIVFSTGPVFGKNNNNNNNNNNGDPFDWTNLMQLTGSDDINKNVPLEIDVFEDPPQGDDVVLDYDFNTNSNLIVTKQQLEYSKDHDSFQTVSDHYDNLIGTGKIFVDENNMQDFLKKYLGVAKHDFMSQKDYNELIAEGKNPPPPPPKRGGGLDFPLTLKDKDLATPAVTVYEVYSRADDIHGWSILQPVADTQPPLSDPSMRHTACWCGNCVNYSCGICDPVTSTHCYGHPCISVEDAYHAIEHFAKHDHGHDHPYWGGSSIQYTVKIMDRTPPIISTTVPVPPGDELPSLFLPPDPPSTTGDFTAIYGLTITDNYSDVATYQFAFNRKLSPTVPLAWQLASDSSQAQSGAGTKHVFIPDDILGAMEYTVFTWDGEENGNPGMISVAEDQPQSCYGLSALGYKGLSWHDGFPLKFGTSPGIADCLGKNQFGKGKINIDDNDYPNLMIQLINKRDQTLPGIGTWALCFPPSFSDPANRPPTADTDLSSVARVSPSDAFISYENLQCATAASYVQILAATRGNCPADPNFSTFMDDPSKINTINFVKRNFRLEDFSVSDNDASGVQDISAGTMGQRMGFGDRMIVMSNVMLVEDVEYEINLWAEDNVKWINDGTNRVISSPFTGIANVEITVSDPRQTPPLNIKYDSQGEALTYWIPSIRAVFREPVNEVLSPLDSEATWDTKCPHIEAIAKDFKGNKRSLKVYFNVTDEHSRIRVLEQKHIKN